AQAQTAALSQELNALRTRLALQDGGVPAASRSPGRSAPSRPGAFPAYSAPAPAYVAAVPADDTALRPDLAPAISALPPAAPANGPQFHTVRAGETLSGIARQ